MLLDHLDLPLRLQKDPPVFVRIVITVSDPPSTIFKTTQFQTENLHFFFFETVVDFKGAIFQAFKIFQDCFHI